MVVYKIKRGLLANLAGATLQAYEPAFTTDTNELFIGDTTGSPVKVTDHIKVETLPEAANAIAGKYYVVVGTGATNGTVYLFDGTGFISLSTDLTSVTNALSAVQASLVGIQADIDSKATQADLDIEKGRITALEPKVTANETAIAALQSDLATHETDTDAKYATKAEVTTATTGLATEDFVTNRISDVVGAAPEALDTLAEIATRLNDDADAAAVVKILAESNRDAIATKAEQADLTGVTDRVTVLENTPAVAGTNIEVDGVKVAGDVKFVGTGAAEVTLDETTKTVTIHTEIPVIETVDGGSF